MALKYQLGVRFFLMMNLVDMLILFQVNRCFHRQRNLSQGVAGQVSVSRLIIVLLMS